MEPETATMESVSQGTKIETSVKVVYFRIATLGFLLFFACAMTTIFFGLFSLGTNFGFFVFVMIWIVCFFIWLIGSYMAYKQYRNTTYVLSDDALSVTKGGFFKSVTDLYRYDSIISVHIGQNFAGKTFGYSDLVINIPKLEKNVVLVGVVDPLKQAETIKRHINEVQAVKLA